MKYIIRSIKYFFYLMLVLCLILVIMITAGLVEGNIANMFVNGYDSIWQIALFMAVFALIYPRFGYTSRTARVYGSAEQAESILATVMDIHEYKLKSSDGGQRCYVKRSPIARALRMWEDQIVVEPTAGGFEVEGSSKDVVRIISGIEAASQQEDV